MVGLALFNMPIYQYTNISQNSFIDIGIDIFMNVHIDIDIFKNDYIDINIAPAPGRWRQS